MRVEFRRYNRRLPELEQWVQRPTEPARRMLADLALITFITTAALVVIYGLWSAHLRVVFGYGGDGLLNDALAKNIVQTGWVQTSSRLGAPFGQSLYDFPISGDNGNFLIMRAMAIFTSDWSLIINGFLLFSFYTSAWSSYLSLRWLRCGRVSAVVCALLFAFAPYHFARGEGHLFLSSYLVVPIAVLLTVRASSGRPLIARLDRGTEASWRAKAWFHARSTLPWVVLCLACASFGSYYMFFTVITIAMAALLIAATKRSIKPLLTAVSYCALVVAMFAFNLLPNLLYRAKHGVNPVATMRQANELDMYGLRVIQMLTPVPGHKLGLLRQASETLSGGFPSEPSAAQFFGSVAASALLLMLGWLAIIVIRADQRSRHDVRAVLGCLTVAWILIATTGGLDWFLILINFSQIRAWNRVSILLMFTSLAWLALTVGPTVRLWATARTIRRPIVLVVAIAVLVLGLVDQSSRGARYQLLRRQLRQRQAVLRDRRAPASEGGNGVPAPVPKIPRVTAVVRLFRLRPLTSLLADAVAPLELRGDERT